MEEPEESTVALLERAPSDRRLGERRRIERWTTGRRTTPRRKEEVSLFTPRKRHRHGTPWSYRHQRLRTFLLAAAMVATAGTATYLILSQGASEWGIEEARQHRDFQAWAMKQALHSAGGSERAAEILSGMRGD